MIEQLPRAMNGKQSSLLFRELKGQMSVERPCMVLDCSAVSQMGGSYLNLLLGCLEEAMKRNGDVKLSALPEQAKVALRLNGGHRLFEIFATNAEAVSSFQRHTAYRMPNTSLPPSSSLASESTA
jgi:anti-anti-sigma regulatory factor